MKGFLAFLLLNFSTLIFSQSNYYLKPVEHPLFSNLSSDYYYLIRATLVRNDNPTLALLKTSHLPESILYVSHDLNDGKYYLNFKVAKKSIWEKYYNNSKKKIEVDSLKKRIENESYELLKELFDFNLNQTKFDPNYEHYFDGEQYLFHCERKTGNIEAVAEDSDVAKTIKICEKIIGLLKSSNSHQFNIPNDIQSEIKRIIKK